MSRQRESNEGPSLGWILVPVFFLALVFLPFIVSDASRTRAQDTINAITKDTKAATGIATSTGTLPPSRTATSTATPVVTTTPAVSAYVGSSGKSVTSSASVSRAGSNLTVMPPVRAAGTTTARVAICHRTGSGQNPFTVITVDVSALPAHRAHDDIIPAPSAGCPANPAPSRTSAPTRVPAPATNTPTPRSTAVGYLVPICHATGSASHPYNNISVAKAAVAAHKAHGDIVPVPAGGCPANALSATAGNSGGKGPAANENQKSSQPPRPSTHSTTNGNDKKGNSSGASTQGKSNSGKASPKAGSGSKKKP